MSAEITPALTAEEWASFPDWPLAVPDQSSLPLYYPTKHGIAAANLHGHPFGFAQEDVTALGELLEYAYAAFGGAMTPTENDPAWQRCADLKDRLAALLPPPE